MTLISLPDQHPRNGTVAPVPMSCCVAVAGAQAGPPNNTAESVPLTSDLPSTCPAMIAVGSVNVRPPSSCRAHHNSFVTSTRRWGEGGDSNRSPGLTTLLWCCWAT